MTEIQVPENNSPDPRWIVLRVSRINLGITLLGALLALPLMWWINGVPLWIRLSLLLAIALCFAWDLRLILQKGQGSVAAFYLFDLDDDPKQGTPPGTKVAPSWSRNVNESSPRLGIRVRFLNGSNPLVSADHEGIVVPGAFVSPWFSALRYRLKADPPWRRWWPRVVALWPDSLDAAQFRATRVALKWK